MYKDFEETNKFWLPVKNEDGNIRMTLYHSNFQTAGDTDSVVGDTLIYVNGEQVKIEDFYGDVGHDYIKFDLPEQNFVKNTKGLGYLTKSVDRTGIMNEREISYVMKHTVEKRMFEIKSHVIDSSVRITEDHSIMVMRSGVITSTRPTELEPLDQIVIMADDVTFSDNFEVIDLGVMELDVYDIEVEDNHNFFANDILVHNSCYMHVPESMEVASLEDIDEFTDICDEIASITNEGFNEFCKDMFNMPDERKGSIAADREAISDKSLFITKKRYIMHLVNMEGEKCDKLKIMGVEIIKSDTSPALKKMLMDLVNLILDGNDMEFVLDEVKKMKKWFYTQPMKDICTPSNCKTLLKAQKAVEMTGSMKGLHYSARSALFYNSQCGDRDTFVRAGDKIGIVYIKHPQSKYVGFPIDADMLPDWLDELVVDYDQMWQNAYKKITNYLESMGWDIKSRKKEVKKTLFGFK